MISLVNFEDMSNCKTCRNAVACVDVITTLLAYYEKTNTLRIKIDIRKGACHPSSLLATFQTKTGNKTKSNLGVSCTLKRNAISSANELCYFRAPHIEECLECNIQVQGRAQFAPYIACFLLEKNSPVKTTNINKEM